MLVSLRKTITDSYVGCSNWDTADVYGDSEASPISAFVFATGS
jgi:hypothetical protein